MAFASAGERIWPVPPDWSNGVRETLAFGTDVLTASATAVTQHRSFRTSPRRVFSFETLAGEQDRRVADMLLAGWGGAWQLPIWPDVQWLASTLVSGATSVPCATDGFDFVAGGKALLYSAVNSWEVVTVASIASDHIALASAASGTFAAGARLYPLRRARVRGGAEERLYNDQVGRRSLAFDIDEPCDWPTLSGVTTYLGHDVLDVRPSERDDPAASVSRLEQGVDYGAALPVVHDLPGVSLRVQQSSWLLSGRAQHTWFRSLLYTRCGRLVPIWVPSFAADLKPAGTIAGGSTSLSIEWTGYTLFGLGQANRRDLRIELTDGGVLYRRVTAAVEAGATETLTLNASLDAGSIAPERIRAVSFMALCTQGSDETEIDHQTDADGIATATTGWQAVVPDV
jgi:hypothetical protein